MKNQFTAIKSRTLPRFRRGICISALVLLLGVQSGRAGSATWNLNPTSGDWNIAANWTPASVPNRPADIATAITVGNNTFQANYEGGDENDLTLTVVPEPCPPRCFRRFLSH